MALDIYWKEWQHERYLGSLEIDVPLDGLLHEFGKLTGIVIDPYSNNRLHPTLWLRLQVLASQRAYPIQLFKEITAGFPADQSNGMLLLRGDQTEFKTIGLPEVLNPAAGFGLCHII